MSTALVTDAPTPAQPSGHQAADPAEPSVRVVLTCYTRTLLVPLAACTVLLLAWTLTGAGGWPAPAARPRGSRP